MKTIMFDMDGTIANLYEVENWLEMLRSENEYPYANALPLVEMAQFNELLQKLQNKGYKIGIVSWLSKNSSKEYDKKVRKAKKEWLKKYITIKFDEIHIVKYGTRKDYIVNDKFGILFDDEEQNRNNWRGVSFNQEHILEVLKSLI